MKFIIEYIVIDEILHYYPFIINEMQIRWLITQEINHMFIFDPVALLLNILSAMYFVASVIKNEICIVADIWLTISRKIFARS